MGWGGVGWEERGGEGRGGEGWEERGGEGWEERGGEGRGGVGGEACPCTHKHTPVEQYCIHVQHTHTCCSFGMMFRCYLLTDTYPCIVVDDHEISCHRLGG